MKDTVVAKTYISRVNIVMQRGRQNPSGIQPMPDLRPARTREHYIADLSVNYVEKLILLREHTVDIRRYDYGYDLFVKTYDYKGNIRFEHGEVENGEINLQLKATDNLNVLKDGRTISFTIDRRHVELWSTEPMPVILIIYDVTSDTAYWLYVQHYFASSSFKLTARQKYVALHVPMQNVLQLDTIDTFRQYKSDVLTQMRQSRNLHG